MAKTVTDLSDDKIAEMIRSELISGVNMAEKYKTDAIAATHETMEAS
jgi:hypothetical protein